MSTPEPDRRDDGIEIISQHKTQIGQVAVTFTVGRLTPKRPRPADVKPPASE